MNRWAAPSLVGLGVLACAAPFAMRKVSLSASLFAHVAAIGGAVVLGGGAWLGPQWVRWQARCAMELGAKPVALEPPAPTASELEVPPAAPEVASELDARPIVFEEGKFSDLQPTENLPALPPPQDPMPACHEWLRSLRATSCTATPCTTAAQVEARADLPPAKDREPQPVGGDQAAEEVPAAPDETTNQPPKYPLESRRRGEQGTVTVELEIDAEGRVAAARIARSSGYVRLDRAALVALRSWRFAPATRLGVAVALKLEQRVQFCLDS